MKEGYIRKTAWAAFVEALDRTLSGLRALRGGRDGRFPPPEGEARRCLCLDRPAHGAPKGSSSRRARRSLPLPSAKTPKSPQKTRVSLDAGPQPRDAVILGGRPCDARGFTILDRVFLEADPYYRERRERTTIITLACPGPLPDASAPPRRRSRGQDGVGRPRDRAGRGLLHRGPHGERRAVLADAGGRRALQGRGKKTTGRGRRR